MELLVDTSSREKIIVALMEKGAIKDRLSASKKNAQAKSALFYIDKLLGKNKITIFDLKKIKVADSGDSFTSLRSGLAIANALGFALGVKVEPLFGKAKPQVFKKNKQKFYIVKARYNKEPNITYKKSAPSRRFF